MGPRIPAGRKGDARELAATVVFLASDAAGYVTGQTLPGRRRDDDHLSRSAMPAIAPGPTRQQPPTSRAPASNHAVTRSGANVASPVHDRASASQTSPLFG